MDESAMCFVLMELINYWQKKKIIKMVISEGLITKDQMMVAVTG